MEDNLILEGLLSMVTELKEKQEAQATPASRGPAYYNNHTPERIPLCGYDCLGEIG